MCTREVRVRVDGRLYAVPESSVFRLDDTGYKIWAKIGMLMNDHMTYTPNQVPQIKGNSPRAGQVRHLSFEVAPHNLKTMSPVLSQP